MFCACAADAASADGLDWVTRSCYPALVGYFPGPTSTHRSSSLPFEAQAELNQARVKCIADLPHPALVEAVFRQLEVRVIEHVEKLCAKLQVHGLVEGKSLAMAKSTLTYRGPRRHLMMFS